MFCIVGCHQINRGKKMEVGVKMTFLSVNRRRNLEVCA